ncbi:MAG: SPOR domain-containing protein [Crocinitomicaceae bacterium]|nr:SPOR domain-containing protein [Crocinitomicaceae bacterium]
MMYRHTVTVYDKTGKLLAKIPDKVKLADYGFTEYTGESYLGGPVEACFSNSGKCLWVSNYNMIGDGFNNPGCDGCNGKNYDPGFIYKINTETFSIDKIIKVGAVPKYLCISPNEKTMVVSNWSSGDISIVDLVSEKEIKRVDVGAHPRGVAISSDSKWAYVTVMGSTKIAKVNLTTHEVTYIEKVGKSPRHVLLSSNDSLMYVSLNSGNSLLQYNLCSGDKKNCSTNSGPRSMILSPDEKYLYVVNYFANTFSKIRTDSMTVMEVVETGHHPIGITANWDDAEIWVACYEGKIEVFRDFHLAKEMHKENYIFEDELALFMQLFQPKFISGNTTDVKTDKPELKSEIKDDETEESVVTEEVVTIEVKGVSKQRSSELAETDYSQPKHVPQKKVTEDNVSQQNGNCNYHVIVGSFSIKENAVQFKSTVSGKGYNAVLIESTKGLTYVSAACYQTREDATAAISAIYKDLDVNGWVLKY